MSTPWCTFVCVADEQTGALEATIASVRRQRGGGVIAEHAEVIETAARRIEQAVGWVGLLDPGDVLATDAVARLRERIDAVPDADGVYSDETWCADDGRRMPFYKPAWSPDRLRCQPYVGRLAIFRADVVRGAGGLDAQLGASAEHDLLLRIGERTTAIEHVPMSLCDRRTSMLPPYPRFADDELDRAIAVTDAHLWRAGLAAVARRHPEAPGLLRLGPRLESEPAVSIVIPTGGARRRVRGTERTLVTNCVRSLVERSTYRAVEIVCVVDPNVDQGIRDELVELAPDRVHLVDFDEAFHFARKVNRGVLAGGGEIVVMLNDDTEVRTPGWLEAMLVYALDPDVGAVGARLLFEDGRIQHAGVVGVGGNPGHPYHGLPSDTPGYAGNALVPGNFLAVTGACLMTRRDAFLRVGGMSAWFPASYNDLDYCLKLHRAGLRIVATPDAVLDHFESSSRDGTVGDDELELIRRRWGRLLRDDPFYGPNFTSGIADFEPGPV